MSRRVATEPRDRRWADAYEQEVERAFADSFKDDEFRGVTCATSICEIKVGHPTLANQERFQHGLTGALPEGWIGFHIDRQKDGNGDPVSLVHVIRRGYDGWMKEETD
jgi:hypothetical protein